MKTLPTFALFVAMLMLGGCAKMTIPPSPPPQVEYRIFVAQWCRGCLEQREVYMKLAEMGHKVFVVDIDRYPEIAKQHNVTAVPTYVVLPGGARIEGRATLEQLLELGKQVKR